MNQPDKVTETEDESNPIQRRIKSRRAYVAEHYGLELLNDMAKRFGVSIGTISADVRFLKDNGLISKGKAEPKMKRVAELYGKMSLEDISKEIGISTKSVESYVRKLKDSGRIPKGRKHNIPSISKQDKIRSRRAYVAEHYGIESQSDMAKRFGVSSSTISLDIKSLRENGVITNEIKIVHSKKEKNETPISEEKTSGKQENESKNKQYIKQRISDILSHYRAGESDKAMDVMKELKAKFGISSVEKYVYLMRILHKAGKRQERETEDDAR